MTVRLQEWIHKIEVGPASTFLAALCGVVGLMVLALFYNMASFHNLDNAAGMDQAQLARNLAEGRGYTTRLIRPFSLNLLYRRATNVVGIAAEGEVPDPRVDAARERWLDRMQERHPDLVNPPLYPVLVAGLWKATPFLFAKDPDNAPDVQPPDVGLAIMNQCLLILVALLTYQFARGLFDASVAWMSVVVMGGSVMFWDLTLSGTSILLQILLVLILARLLLGLERGVRGDDVQGGRMVMLAVLCGVLVALACLTRYSLGFLLLPVAVMIGTLPYPRRGLLVTVCLLTCLLLVGPWLVRNYHLSGAPFGAAGFGLFHDTFSFPEETLERSVNPDFREFTTREITQKLVMNSRDQLIWELPRYGGTWAGAFFLVGLLVPFRNPILGRIRLWLVFSLMLLFFIRALGGRAVMGSDGLNPMDPLLLVVAPLVFVYGVSLFFTLLDRLVARFEGTRSLAVGAFCLAITASLILTLLSPKPSALAYPPYFPPWIAEKATYLDPDEWMMSDMPAAVAWYGDQSCVLWPAEYRTPGTGVYRNDFFEIHDRFKSVNGLYLSKNAIGKVNTDPLQSWISRNDEDSWEEELTAWETFILVGIYLKNEVPRDFPMKNAPLGIFPELFLVDSERNERK